MKFDYTGIRVKDLEESIRFYTEILGMEVVSRSKIPKTKGEIVYLKSPNSDHRLELNYYENSSQFASPYSKGEELDHLAFIVEDVNTALSTLTKKGVEVVLEPIEEGGWRWGYITDPNGIWIELYQKID